MHSFSSISQYVVCGLEALASFSSLPVRDYEAVKVAETLERVEERKIGREVS